MVGGLERGEGGLRSGFEGGEDVVLFSLDITSHGVEVSASELVGKT